jgi:dihydroorotate dehydrogenase electron transfer subunit
LSRAFRAEIKENLPLNANHNLLSLVNLDPMDEPRPGQFYMLQVNRGLDPLLKRAFSLFRRTPGGFQILYRIKGKGTALLSEMKKGAVIEILGPLGNGFPLPTRDENPLIIAGGVGIASVFSLAETLPKRAVIYGARVQEELFMTGDLGKILEEAEDPDAIHGVVLCTDDGSCGIRGTVADVLHDFLQQGKGPGRPVIYACGPHPMLKEIARIASSHDIKAYVSLEEHMACGIGACLGCVTKTKAGYERVCKEGPVFDAAEIEW